MGAMYFVTCLIVLIYSCCSLDDSFHTLLNFFALILSSVNGFPVLILYGKYTSSLQFWSGYPVVSLNVNDIRSEGRLLISEPRNETSSLFLQATGGTFNRSTFFYRAVFDQAPIDFSGNILPDPSPRCYSSSRDDWWLFFNPDECYQQSAGDIWFVYFYYFVKLEPDDGRRGDHSIWAVAKDTRQTTTQRGSSIGGTALRLGSGVNPPPGAPPAFSFASLALEEAFDGGRFRGPLQRFDPSDLDLGGGVMRAGLGQHYGGCGAECPCGDGGGPCLLHSVTYCAGCNVPARSLAAARAAAGDTAPRVSLFWARGPADRAEMERPSQQRYIYAAGALFGAAGAIAVAGVALLCRGKGLPFPPTLEASGPGLSGLSGPGPKDPGPEAPTARETARCGPD